MESFSASLALCAWNSPVTGEFPAQRPVTRSFNVFVDLRLNKRLSKQSWGWWFETPSCSFWRYCNGVIIWLLRCQRNKIENMGKGIVRMHQELEFKPKSVKHTKNVRVFMEYIYTRCSMGYHKNSFVRHSNLTYHSHTNKYCGLRSPSVWFSVRFVFKMYDPERTSPQWVNYVWVR